VSIFPVFTMLLSSDILEQNFEFSVILDCVNDRDRNLARFRYASWGILDE
jgi:hypothetical protein